MKEIKTVVDIITTEETLFKNIESPADFFIVCSALKYRVENRMIENYNRFDKKIYTTLESMELPEIFETVTDVKLQYLMAKNKIKYLSQTVLLVMCIGVVTGFKICLYMMGK